MSEPANQAGEAPLDAPTPSDEPSPDEPSPTPAQPKSGLLAELLEGAEPANPRGLAPPNRSPLRSDSPLEGGLAGGGVRVGWLVEWASGSAPTVDFEGNDLGPIAARSVIPLDPSLVAQAIAERRGVLLSFEYGRADAASRPIITGLLQPLVFEVDSDSDSDSDSESESITSTDDQADTDPLPNLHANVDGKRVEIEAADEIVLRCGQASIVLRRNGRVVIRGTYVETRSRGVNRIKGGSVQIN